MNSSGRCSSLGLALCLVAFGCRSGDAPTSGALGAETVLRAGSLSLHEGPGLVPVSPTEAERDLVFAAGRAEGAPGARVAVERAVLARALLEELRREASAVPLSQEDEERARAALWRELDAPEAVRFVAVQVPVPALAPGDLEEAVALAIERATREDVAPSEFVAHAEAEKRDDVDVLVRVLPPITRDGRLLPKGPKDEVTAELPTEVLEVAKAGLSPGERSSLVASANGYWLLFGLERFPARRLPEAEALERVAAFVVERRARPGLESLDRELRRVRPVRWSPRATELLALAWAEP